MTTQDLLDKAVSNFKQNISKLTAIAEHSTYSNPSTPELKDIWAEARLSFTQCLELKALHQAITNRKSIGQ